MIGDFVGWYFASLAEFWGSAVRIGLPHILLAILIVLWIRRRGCGDSNGNRRCCCCWLWTCGRGPKGSTCCADAGGAACDAEAEGGDSGAEGAASES